MYGLGGRRGIIRTRILSFSLYVGRGRSSASIIVPLVLVGPTLLGELLPEQVDFLDSLYWPVASLLSVRLADLALPRQRPGPDAVATRPARCAADPA